MITTESEYCVFIVNISKRSSYFINFHQSSILRINKKLEYQNDPSKTYKVDNPGPKTKPREVSKAIKDIKKTKTKYKKYTRPFRSLP